MKQARIIMMKRCISDWVCENKFRFLYAMKKKWPKVAECFFAYIGLMVSLSEVESLFFSTEYLSGLFKKYTCWVLIAIILIALFRNRQPLSKTCFVGNSDTRITLKVGNILRSKNGALVIPTNTTFDTTMKNEFISIRSVQGQYQEKYFWNKIEDLDCLITADLLSQGTDFDVLTDRITTKKNRYSLGTTAKIEHENVRAYFLAIADVNKNGRPENVTLSSILESLAVFWEYISNAGHEEPLVFPVIGTGRAGIRDASMCEVIKEMIFSFIVSNKECHITNNMIIYIHPRDLEERNLIWEEVAEYLEITCKHFCVEHKVINTKNAGKPVT